MESIFNWKLYLLEVIIMKPFDSLVLIRFKNKGISTVINLLGKVVDRDHIDQKLGKKK